MAGESKAGRFAVIITAVAALITAVTGAVTNGFGLFRGSNSNSTENSSQQNGAETGPQNPGPALRAAEQQASAWLRALSNRDVDTLTRLSDPPFFFDQGDVLLDKAQIRDSYVQAFESPQGPKGEIHIQKIKAELISDLKQRGWDPHHDRLMNSLRLTDDDIVVEASSGGESMALFFRRDGNKVELAGSWD